METVSEGYALFRIYNKVTPNIRIPAEYLLLSSCYTEEKAILSTLCTIDCNVLKISRLCV